MEANRPPAGSQGGSRREFEVVPVSSNVKRTTLMRRILMAMAMAICFQATNASADVIVSLQSGTTTTINQSGTGTLYISAMNSGTASIDFGALALGIQIVANGSPAGDITLSGVDAPENSVWFDPSTSGPTDGNTLENGNINGTAGYSLVGISGAVDAEGNYGVLAPGETANLAMLSFTAAADAFGTWNIFVVNEEAESGATISNITAGDLSTIQFSNLTAPAFPNTGVSVQVGSVIVVPEPSTLTVAGLGCAVVGYAAWKRRRNG